MPRSPYIAGLRARVGDTLLVLPSVSAFLFDEAGRLLLAQAKDSGRWITIGGMVEPDEDPADAVVRECREETGLEVRAVALVGAFGGPDFRITYPNGDRASYAVSYCPSSS